MCRMSITTGTRRRMKRKNKKPCFMLRTKLTLGVRLYAAGQGKQRHLPLFPVFLSSLLPLVYEKISAKEKWCSEHIVPLWQTGQAELFLSKIFAQFFPKWDNYFTNCLTQEVEIRYNK